MRFIMIVLFFTVLFGCRQEKQRPGFDTVGMTTIFEDTVSIRAITLMGQDLGFAGSQGVYGIYNANERKARTNVQLFDTIAPSFRAVGNTTTDFFMLSIANPALLYKTGDDGNMQLIYTEQGEKVFYDSLKFWNDLEGIAMGDPTQNCLSMIITRDGGNTWNKIDCSLLPKTVDGEAAFAASNTNIAIVKDHTWIVSGGKKSRVFYSPDKGKSWEVFETPIIQGEPTQGMYSVDFYDEKNGFVIGGDYTKPEGNSSNKAVTNDGGRTWKLVSDAGGPGYKSCVQYVPNANGKELVAVGFTGISYSKDAGQNWKELSKEGFYTIKFLNDSVAYAAGKNRIAKLVFR